MFALRTSALHPSGPAQGSPLPCTREHGQVGCTGNSMHVLACASEERGLPVLLAWKGQAAEVAASWTHLVWAAP